MIHHYMEGVIRRFVALLNATGDIAADEVGEEAGIAHSCPAQHEDVDGTSATHTRTRMGTRWRWRGRAAATRMIGDEDGATMTDTIGARGNKREESVGR
jgi:hypothetical protein